MEMVGGCCVCLDERGWDENPLVYCDGHGCNVAVHQACYGIVKVPKGPWFCCKCQSTERVARVKCELCPFKEGALKRTDNGGWAHVVCALYIPEVRFGNVTTMEPILITSIPNERFLKTCYICEENGRESKTSNGACTSCNKPGCKLNFHVTCAQSKRMLCEEAGHCGNVQYVGYCSQHWSKKNKGHTTGNSDPKKSTKEKEKEKVQRSRQDSVSSSDGSSNKQKNKKQNNSAKSALNSSDSIQDIAAHVHALPSKVNNFIDMKTEPQKLTAVYKAGNAEQSAAESLNLLQQLPSIMDYFPPDARPKTPLNTVIPPLSSPTQFSLPGVFNQPQNSSNSIEVTEDLIDVESTKTPPLNLTIDSQKMPSQKATDKQKSGPSTTAKSSTPLAKSFLPPKKPITSHPKSSMSNSKNHESKKRKTADAEKPSKKQKIEDKKKLQAKKREKHNDLSIPRPSKLKLYDDDRIPPLLSSKKRDQSSETLKDLMEMQWDQGAQLLFQKATHFNVGSLMSCLHQLKAENEDLESRLGELSARRDRLVAATSRLSKPFDASAELNRQLPLSSMLSKLNSSPSESKRGCKEKRPSKSKLKATESEDSASIKTSRSKKMKTSNGLGKPEKCDSPDNPECCSDSSLDGLGCKEVLSEDNSLNSSPKTAKPTKKEQKRKEGSSYPDEARTTKHFANNLHSLVQPPISLHSDPSQVVGDAGYSKNPSEFIQQMMMKQQIDMNRLIHQGESVQQGSPNVMDYFSAQMTNGNTRKEVKSNGQVDRSPTAHVSGPYRPVITSNSRGKSPKENGK